MGNACCKCLKTKSNESIESVQNVRDHQLRLNGQNGNIRQGKNGQRGQNGHSGHSGQSGQNGQDGLNGQRDSSIGSDLGNGRNISLKYEIKTSDNGLIIDCFDQTTGATEQATNNGNGTDRHRELFKDHCQISKHSVSNRRRLLSGKTPAGNFIDCQNRCDKRYIYVVKEWSTWSDSICQIRYPNGTATGFRVGSRYIMTVFHVVDKIDLLIDGPTYYRDRDGILHVPALEHMNVFCLFEYYKESGFVNAKKYFLKSIIRFANAKTDTAILELKDNSEHSMPPPFELSSGQNPITEFTLIGHNGGPMEYNEVNKVIDRDSKKTYDDIQWVKNHSLEKTRSNYELEPNSVLLNKERILFHCKFSHGASGTPGVVVLNGRAVVVTMLLCGYPEWYYEPTSHRRIRSDWPEEYCIEQGADILSIGKTMSAERPKLHRNIFCQYLPDPVLQEHRY